jgi:hypothetical protein
VAAYCLDYYEESSQLDDLSVGSAIDIPGRNGKEKVQDPEAAIRVLVRVRLMAVLPIWAKRLLVWAGLAGWDYWVGGDRRPQVSVRDVGNCACQGNLREWSVEPLSLGLYYKKYKEKFNT